jgi:hypothetical protein
MDMIIIRLTDLSPKCAEQSQQKRNVGKVKALFPEWLAVQSMVEEMDR